MTAGNKRNCHAGLGLSLGLRLAPIHAAMSGSIGGIVLALVYRLRELKAVLSLLNLKTFLGIRIKLPANSTRSIIYRRQDPLS